jgi:hypothetical protein
MQITENMVHVAGQRWDMRVWLNRGDEDPGFACDHAAIQTYCDGHAELLDQMPYDDICRLIATEFPRTSAVEVLDTETRCGVLLYPNWP